MKKLFAFSAFLFWLITARAQDLSINNTNTNLLYTNPAFAGSNGGVRNQLTYRNQWPNLNANFFGLVNSTDLYVKPLRAGIGLTLYDIEYGGTFKGRGALVTYAQHISLAGDKIKFIPSVQVGYCRNVQDFAIFYPADTSNGFIWNSHAPEVSTKSYVDLNAGFLLKLKQNFYLGAYYFHLNRPDGQFYDNGRLSGKLLLNASYNWHLSESQLLQFTWRLNHQYHFSEQQLGINMVLAKTAVMGLATNSFESCIINAGVRHDYFTALISCELLTSRLSGSVYSTWEASLSYNLRSKDQRRRLTNFEEW
jgi:type IX secretion system PorP/SprF family membrane protein